MKRKKGVVLLEAALILPLFLFLILAGLDLLWACDQRANLDHVAINVAQCIKNNGCSDPQAAAATFGQQLHMPNWQSLVVVTDPPSCSTCTTVTLSYQYRAIGPYFRSIPMSTTASAD